MNALNSFSYNTDIAKVFGVGPSVFLTCLSLEYNSQLFSKSLNANDTMSLSRARIYEITGLDDEEQIDIELSLKECGVINIKPLQNVPNKNYYILNNDQLNKILESGDPKQVIDSEKANQFIKGKRVEPTSKRKTHIIQLKKKVNLEDPVLQDYFIQWIDAVYSNPKGFLSPKGVEIAQEELMAYAKNSQEKQISIMRIAIKNGMRDITWAIQRYEDQEGVNSRNFSNYNDSKATEDDIDSSGETF